MKPAVLPFSGSELYRGLELDDAVELNCGLPQEEQQVSSTTKQAIPPASPCIQTLEL